MYCQSVQTRTQSFKSHCPQNTVSFSLLRRCCKLFQVITPELNITIASAASLPTVMTPNWPTPYCLLSIMATDAYRIAATAQSERKYNDS